MFTFRDLPSSERSWVGSRHIDHEVTYFGPVNTYSMKCSYFDRREIMEHLIAVIAPQDSPASEMYPVGHIHQFGMGAGPKWVPNFDFANFDPRPDVWSGNADTDKFWR